jgi:hypothetical protein
MGAGMRTSVMPSDEQSPRVNVSQADIERLRKMSEVAAKLIEMSDAGDIEAEAKYVEIQEARIVWGKDTSSDSLVRLLAVGDKIAAWLAIRRKSN